MNRFHPNTIVNDGKVGISGKQGFGQKSDAPIGFHDSSIFGRVEDIADILPYQSRLLVILREFKRKCGLSPEVFDADGMSIFRLPALQQCRESNPVLAHQRDVEFGPTRFDLIEKRHQSFSGPWTVSLADADPDVSRSIEIAGCEIQ